MTDTGNTFLQEPPDDPVWTNTGLEWVPQERRAEFLDRAAELDFADGDDKMMSVEAGYALLALSQQFDLPMTRVAWGPRWQAPDDQERTANYMLVGLETDYRNGILRVVALDTGPQVAVVFSRFTKKRLAQVP